jgi:hypothetical protein
VTVPAVAAFAVGVPTVVDLILLIATFGAGFWCGSKYGTLRAMFDEIMAKLPRRNDGGEPPAGKQDK